MVLKWPMNTRLSADSFLCLQHGSTWKIIWFCDFRKMENNREILATNLKLVETQLQQYVSGKHWATVLLIRATAAIDSTQDKSHKSFWRRKRGKLWPGLACCLTWKQQNSSKLLRSGEEQHNPSGKEQQREKKEAIVDWVWDQKLRQTCMLEKILLRFELRLLSLFNICSTRQH